ncbi:MAG TPA: CvpA family protein [Hanamia sp.]|jgi:membrane protein required for colicin V production|nr:CvpA family protein [Hanamia sp.]
MLIDVAFFIVMIVAVFKGFTKGFIVGIFSFIAFIIGLAAALKLSVIVANHLQSSAAISAKWLPVISFAVVFIVVVFLVHIGARILKKAFSLVMLGWIDKVGGILLYTCIYTIIFSVILFFAEKTFLIKPETVATSSVHNYVAPWGPKVLNNLGKIIPVFKDLFSQLQSFFETLGHKIES